MELEKLSEESLTRQPEEVFDILCKLGEGSYGSVFKALHKDSRQILAIKQVRFRALIAYRKLKIYQFQPISRSSKVKKLNSNFMNST